MKFSPIIATGLLTVLATGCATVAPAPEANVVARVFLEARPPEPAVRVVLPVSRAQIDVDPRPVLLEFDLVEVTLVTAEFGRALLMRLSGAAARDLYRKTIGAQGRRLVLSLDGHPVGVFAIDAPVGDGLLTFYPEVPEDRLPKLAIRLQQSTTDIRGRLAREK